MEIVFESILLFSLAILVIAVGLLVYYFKKRIADVEQKTTKCLEIVHDVFVQHIQLKGEVARMNANTAQSIGLGNRYSGGEYSTNEYSTNGKYSTNADDDDEEEHIHFNLEENEDDVKIVTVELNGQIDSNINVEDIEEVDDFGYTEKIDEIYDHDITVEPDTHINVVLQDVIDSENRPTNVEPHKIDVNESDLESDSEMSVAKNNETFRDLFNPDTKESYKKMDIKSLRRLVVTRGLATESTPRMRKNELIDVLLTLN
jgi:hypothetical protein